MIKTVKDVSTRSWNEISQKIYKNGGPGNSEDDFTLVVLLSVNGKTMFRFSTGDFTHPF